MKIWIRSGRWLFFFLQPILKIYLKKRTTTRVFIVVNNKVLLTKGWLSNGSYGLPGGGLKKNEQPFEAALREVFEETAIKLKKEDLKYQGQYQTNNQLLSYKYHLFFIFIKHQPVVRNQLIEIVESRWCDIKLIDQIFVSDEVITAYRVWQKTSNLIK